MLDGYNPQRGETRNAVYESLLDKRAHLLQESKIRTCDLVFVYDYDHINQTVDVVLMGDARSKPIRGIPIAGTGGHGVRSIRAWKGFLQTDKPDIGILVYPRLGAGRRFLDFIRRNVAPSTSRVEQTAIFFGGIPAALVAGETQVANVVASPALHQIGKNDNGLVTPIGAGVVIKDNGDVVIRGTRVFFLGLTQVEADAHAVARQGDTGDGGLGAGAIQGGSTKIYAG